MNTSKPEDKILGQTQPVARPLKVIIRKLDWRLLPACTALYLSSFIDRRCDAKLYFKLIYIVILAMPEFMDWRLTSSWRVTNSDYA